VEVLANTGEQLENFPQTFSHIGLINAAWAFEQTHHAGTQILATDPVVAHSIRDRIPLARTLRLQVPGDVERVDKLTKTQNAQVRICPPRRPR
jgi:hypothetical protein